MLWALPVLALALGQAPRVEPSHLVKQLGSTLFAERESALAALEAMGPEALPAIRAATSSTDRELRARAASLLARIESSELTRPTMIQVDVADRPIDEVVKNSESRWPNRLAWHPDTPASVRLRRVTIRETARLPFWAAVDRLCRAGELHYIPGSPDGPGGGLPEFRTCFSPSASPTAPGRTSGRCASN